MSWVEPLKIMSSRKELSASRSRRRPEALTETPEPKPELELGANETMLHPIMIGIIIINTSITVVYWAYILTQAFCKKTEDEDDP